MSIFNMSFSAVFLIMATFSSQVLAEKTKDVEMKDLANSYVSIQDELSKDDYNAAIKHAKMFDAQLRNFHGKEKSKLNSASKSLLQAKDLKTSREAFKKLSTYFVEWTKKSKSKEYIVVYCPMAGSSWIQKDGEVRNPFFGSEMLHCGEKK